VPDAPGGDWLRSSHNRLNLGAAFAVLNRVGVDREQALRVICDFQGVGRRMEKLGITDHGVTIFSDYGHHPTALKATLQGARNRFPNARIWAVWQPHTYSRTHLLAHEFAEAFASANHALITDIYAAREQPSPGTDPAMIADWGKESGHADVRASGDLIATARILSTETQPGDVVIIFSAGDAPTIGTQLLSAKTHDSTT
jgi:UDP-N-acetylmuramate--alanine ligase